MRKKFILFFISVIYILYMLSPIYAETVTWDVFNNFDNYILGSKNIELVYVDNKPSYYTIRKNSIVDTADIDLYLNFDNELRPGLIPEYKILVADLTYREKDSFINKSAFFYKTNHKIELEGSKRAFFYPGEVIGSFSVSFWIKPYKMSSEETVFKIGAHYYNEESNSVEDQSITAFLDEGIFTCRFSNVLFFRDLKKVRDIELSTYERVVPGKWSHISMTYNALEGVVKLYINGLENAVIMSTEDGNRFTSPLNLYFNEKNRCIVSLASGYTGSLDEFIISRNSNVSFRDMYSPTGGTILSQVIELDSHPVTLKNVSFNQETDNRYSTVNYYIRFSDNSFYANDDNVIKKQEWFSLSNELIHNVTARYVQWKAVLLPGAGGEIAPKFRGITLDYEKDFPPTRPVGIKAISDKGVIKLKWLMNTEKDLKGYKIYYGTHSGHYFSADAFQGESPLRIAKNNYIELTGLTNNVIYYIVITAFDDENGVHESEFSEEIYIRVK